MTKQEQIDRFYAAMKGMLKSRRGDLGDWPSLTVRQIANRLADGCPRSDCPELLEELRSGRLDQAIAAMLGYT